MLMEKKTVVLISGTLFRCFILSNEQFG